jgi:hypothetical protein
MQNRILKGLMLGAACSIMCVNALAVSPGLYMGLMMGPATNGGGPQNVQVLSPTNPPSLPSQQGTVPGPQAYTTTANPKSTQFGSRIYLGYKMNQYAAFEGGFTFFSAVDYILQNQQTGCSGGICTSAAGTSARVRSIDIMGKGDYSYNNTIGIFAKAGISASYITTPGGLNVTNYQVVTTGSPNAPPGSPQAAGTKVINVGSNTYTTKLSPVIAIGASYDLNQNWVMDFTLTRFMIGGNLGSMDSYALGFSYHFVDIYCGQFLCE